MTLLRKAVDLQYSITVLLLFLLIPCSGTAQSDQETSTFLKAKRLMTDAINTSNREPLLQAREVLEPFTKHETLSALAHYYLGYIDYRIGVVIEQSNRNSAVAALDSAVSHLEIAVKEDESFAEAYALLASCYGIKIGFAPHKGIVYGPKSGRLMNKAKTIAPENPRVALLDAIGMYYAPTIFGGGVDKALKGFRRAAQLFASWEDVDPLQPSWGREEVYAWIGIAHSKRNESILARIAFEKALEINPDYGWVKYVLMPGLTKGAKEKE